MNLVVHCNKHEILLPLQEKLDPTGGYPNEGESPLPATLFPEVSGKDLARNFWQKTFLKSQL